MSDLYDYTQWWSMQRDNFDYDVPITTTDSIAYTCGYALTINTGQTLSGTGTLTLGSKTLTMSGTAQSDIDITIASGAHVWTRIAVSGLIAGTRVQVYNVTGAAELYNDFAAGTTLEIQGDWTTDKTIRLRAAYVDGVTAKLPVEQTNVFGSGGVSFLVAQVADSVYDTLAIDGSACSEFTYDNANLQIDVSDADNTTTVQRIYAWTAWIQYSSATALANFFNAIEAVDSLNYIVDTAVVDAQLDNVAATPVIIGGGYLSRNDGTTIIAATSGSIQMDPSRAYQAVGGVTSMGPSPVPVPKIGWTPR